jgi:4-diphosphocytidyl-2-C-methyl-D-erythritol kinase
MTLLRYRPCAKVNLGLEVLGTRPDGYHEVRTVLQSIALHDLLEVNPAPGDISFTCTDPAIPAGEENLVMKAARLIQRETGCAKGARIHLVKRIPSQAGLGGGSADAACTLLALDRLWRLGLAPPVLASLAARLGSDVPFFLVGGTALALGRGEEVYPLPDAPPLHLLVVKPARGMSTAEAYARIDRTLTAPRELHRIALIVQGLVEGRLNERLCFNRFEEVALPGSGEGSAIRQALLEGGASLAILAGSGSAWVGLFPDRGSAQATHRRMSHRGISGVLTTTTTRKDYWELTQPRRGKESLP